MKRLILAALAATLFGGIGAGYAVGTAFDKESDANVNLIFARTAGQDVIRQTRAMSPDRARKELAWLADCQAETTRDCIARTGGL